MSKIYNVRGENIIRQRREMVSAGAGTGRCFTSREASLRTHYLNKDLKEESP